MFNQFQASIKLSLELTILVDKIQQYGLTIRESLLEDNYTSYYSHSNKTIGVDLASSSYMINALLHEFGHHLQTLDSNYSKTWDKYYQEEDAWDRGEGFYNQTFGKPIGEEYHIQKASSLNTYQDYQGYSCQYFHWELNNIGKEPSIREGIFPLCCDISLSSLPQPTTVTESVELTIQPQLNAEPISVNSLIITQPVNTLVKKGFNWSSFLIVGITTSSLLIGGVITFNSLQPKQPSQEQCTDYNCIF